MADLISRAAALNAIDCWHIDFNSMDGAKAQTDCWRTIKELPAVDAVSVVHAHYVKGSNGEWYCSNCRRIDDKYSVARYCWNCGAKMDGERRDSE